MLKKIFIIIKEYGFIWTFNRTLYEVKLWLLRKCPKLQLIFEREVSVKRIDLIDVDVQSLRDFLNRLPQRQKDDIIRKADNAANGKIEAFGKTEFDYGSPIDWQLNPASGKRCDEKKEWFFIPDFDKEVGDIKNIWEISRFAYMYYYVRAYLLTEDRKYYLAFSGQLAQWLERNEYGKGANYKCGQECSIRMINALIVYSAFDKLGITSEQDRANLTRLINYSYKKVKSNFFYAHRCVKIDHLIAEACGLLTGAWCCGKEKDVRKYGKLIMGEIKKQFSLEGLYLSYSFHYQRYVLEWMEYIYKISKKANIVIDPGVEEVLYKAAQLLNSVSNNEGEVPNYGSNDGTLIFKVTACEHNDFRPIINTIMLLTGHEKIYSDGFFDEEWLWFGDMRELKAKSLPENSSTKQFFVFVKERFTLMVNAHNYKTRPAHMDQMHIDLWVDGKNVFCDSGSYSYANETGDSLTLTSAHNTVFIQGKNQIIRSGRFLTYGKPMVKVFDVNNENFDGQASFISGYSHRRKIKVEQECIVLEDWVLTKENENHYEILFHTPCDVKVVGAEIAFWYQEKLMCTLTSEAQNVIIDDAKRSTHYMSLEPIKCVRLISEKQYCRTTIAMRGM
ncbi:MAG: heparinase II/III family protein [Lachnospiraceae bacterium]|nr:heparinase II/III family protein [Lachnospiraceae bacterium]